MNGRNILLSVLVWGAMAGPGIGIAGLLPGGAQAAPGGPEIVLFDSGDLSRHKDGTPITRLGLDYNGDPTTSNNTVVRGGEIVSAISVDKGERRADMVIASRLPEAYFIDGDGDARVGVDLIYEITSYIPEGWKPDGIGELFWQWHGIPDFDQGETWRNPIAAIYFNRDRLEFNRRAESKRVHRPADWQDYEEFEIIDIGKVDIGRDVQWRLEVKWSHDYADPGYMRLYKDGELLFARENTITTFNDEKGRYMIFGLYKWDWPDQVDRVRSREMRFKNIRILAPVL